MTVNDGWSLEGELSTLFRFRVGVIFEAEILVPVQEFRRRGASVRRGIERSKYHSHVQAEVWFY
jgi:hypothetical protein